MERKMFSVKDWNRIECRLIRGLFIVLFSPVIVLIWMARLIDDYGSDFIDWFDDVIENICWYYSKWRKSKEIKK